jgi:hypothetical protein
VRRFPEDTIAVQRIFKAARKALLGERSVRSQQNREKIQTVDFSLEELTKVRGRGIGRHPPCAFPCTEDIQMGLRSTSNDA